MPHLVMNLHFTTHIHITGKLEALKTIIRGKFKKNGF